MSMTVNGVEISDAAIAAEMQHHRAPTQEKIEYSAKLALVARELLLQEAARLNIAGSDEEERLNALIEQAIPVAEPDEEQCQHFFAEHRQRFRSGDLFEVSHILCAAPPDDPAARTTAQQRANQAMQQLEQGAAFASVAEQCSDCPSKANGGSLGQIGLGQTVPEFEQVMMRLQAGETTSEPAESRFGFHIIHLHQKAEGQVLEYEEVRQQIAHYLRDSAQHHGISQYLSRLMQGADIQGIELIDALNATAPAQ